MACPPGTSAAEARARDCWPQAEVDNGLQAALVLTDMPFGNLGLTAHEEAALVAYMKTLDDQDTLQPPAPYVATE